MQQVNDMKGQSHWSYEGAVTIFKWILQPISWLVQSTHNWTQL